MTVSARPRLPQPTSSATLSSTRPRSALLIAPRPDTSQMRKQSEARSSRLPRALTHRKSMKSVHRTNLNN